MKDSKQRIKVAIVVDTLHGGGAEKVCILLCRAFKNEGVDAYLIVVKPLCEYSGLEDINILYLLDDKRARLHKRKVKKQAIDKFRGILTEKGSFDLVLSNLDGAHPIVEEMNFSNAWYVVHNSIEEKLKRAKRLGPIKYFRQKSIYKIFSNKKLIVVSDGLKQEILATRIFSPEKAERIYNPIDVKEIQSTMTGKKLGITNRYLLHVGRFARLKRHDLLFEAFSLHLNKSNTDINLVLLCEDSDKLDRLIARYGLESNVIVAGFQQNPYVWMKGAEALILSSEGEGFGMVLVEAILCSIPVIATDCQHGPSEILGEKYKQYLSPVGDAKALADNIERVLTLKPDMSDVKILNEIQPGYVARQYLECCL